MEWLAPQDVCDGLLKTTCQSFGVVWIMYLTRPPDTAARRIIALLTSLNLDNERAASHSQRHRWLLVGDLFETPSCYSIWLWCLLAVVSDRYIQAVALVDAIMPCHFEACTGRPGVLISGRIGFATTSMSQCLLLAPMFVSCGRMVELKMGRLVLIVCEICTVTPRDPYGLLHLL